MGQKTKAVRKAAEKVEKANQRLQKMESKAADWRRRASGALNLLSPILAENNEYLEMVESEVETQRNLNYELRQDIRGLIALLDENRRTQTMLRQMISDTRKFLSEKVDLVNADAALEAIKEFLARQPFFPEENEASAEPENNANVNPEATREELCDKNTCEGCEEPCDTPDPEEDGEDEDLLEDEE